MRLLVVAQTVDEKDPVLGFFHTWLNELAVRVEQIEVICLTEGVHHLPENVRVHSLGKEKGRPLLGGLAYAVRFKLLAWKLRHTYDRVFVHMNQEYILVAGPMWKLLQKPVYLWRNHYAGSFLTDIAAVFATKVFCTSKDSYTARYTKTKLMPVGVDLARFVTSPQTARGARSILFLARMAPSKRPQLLLDALAKLSEWGVDYSASLYGSPAGSDESFYEALKKRYTSDQIHFCAGVPNIDTPRIYAAHEMFVNTSPSGMYDKTIFEAAASGCIVLANNEDWRLLAGDSFYFDGTVDTLAERLSSHLSATSTDRTRNQEHVRTLAATQGLTLLMDLLHEELKA
ncbi:MAG: hypothetical protein ABA06_04755 [Parcubacteria bacterium C7867-001]|nr:MAG: hypothetical protein ABA06_04755 [Parcubacteria bacterium C7867-001]